MLPLNSTPNDDNYNNFFSSNSPFPCNIIIFPFSDAATLIFVNIFVRGFSDINDVKMVSLFYL